jgi:hypothetical protein
MQEEKYKNRIEVILLTECFKNTKHLSLQKQDADMNQLIKE